MLPIITECAPAASALTISPEYLMPPSAMMGIPYCWATRVHSAIAVNCGTPMRSEEHTSELQSRSDIVCRLLLEKKKAALQTSPGADIFGFWRCRSHTLLRGPAPLWHAS